MNECYIEHDTPGEIARRASLLALATRLKKSGVPITGIGLQGHLRGNTPLDKPGMTKFLRQIQDLGLETMVTELDVDDVDVPAQLIDETVARKYAEFIELVGPFVKVITFEELRANPNPGKRPMVFPIDRSPRCRIPTDPSLFGCCKRAHDLAQSIKFVPPTSARAQHSMVRTEKK